MIDKEIKSQVLSSVEKGTSMQLAFLSALVASGGAISLASKKLSLEFTTNSDFLALEFCRIIKDAYNFGAEILIIRPKDKRSNRYYKAVLPAKVAARVLKDTRILSIDGGGAVSSVNFGVSPLAKKDERHFANYIKGLFLTSGKVFIYEGNYIAELVLPNAAFAEEIADMLAKYSITGRLRNRADKTALILKAGANVANLLTLAGAATSSLALIDMMLIRELNNNINRQANCEAANSDKTASASAKQVIAINKIKALHREDKLSEELREAAELRVANPNMPLAKIAEVLNLSKSGATHRFNKIMAIAEALSTDTKEGKK